MVLKTMMGNMIAWLRQLKSNYYGIQHTGWWAHNMRGQNSLSILHVLMYMCHGPGNVLVDLDYT